MNFMAQKSNYSQLPSNGHQSRAPGDLQFDEGLAIDNNEDESQNDADGNSG